MDVSLHYSSQQASGFDPWSLTGAVRCPVLVLTGEDDPICPLPVVEPAPQLERARWHTDFARRVRTRLAVAHRVRRSGTAAALCGVRGECSLR
jgi:pimeloyl-ACP methyl ester carboxylesterase